MSSLKSFVMWAVVGAICLSGGGCKELEKLMKASHENSPQEEVSAAKAEASSAFRTAYFAAGCFWGVEAAFRRIEGVTETAVGYMGGHTENPTYKQVCSNRTGHAEAVKVVYDPSKVTYEDLLDVFWNIHNPTTKNRQGPDIGTQYRSAIFVDDKEQFEAAVDSRRNLTASGRWQSPIVTEIKRAKKFYRAEEYHQQYIEKNGQAACSIPGEEAR